MGRRRCGLLNKLGICKWGWGKVRSIMAHDIEQIADYIASQSGLDKADRFLSKLDAK